MDKKETKDITALVGTKRVSWSLSLARPVKKLKIASGIMMPGSGKSVQELS
jgi:hypothetical protein